MNACRAVPSGEQPNIDLLSFTSSLEDEGGYPVPRNYLKALAPPLVTPLFFARIRFRIKETVYSRRIPPTPFHLTTLLSIAYYGLLFFVIGAAPLL